MFIIADLVDFPNLKQLADGAIIYADKLEEEWKRNSVDENGQPKFHSDDDCWKALIKSFDNPNEVKLKQYFENCSDHDVYAIMVLMYIGRDYRNDEIDDVGIAFKRKCEEIGGFGHDCG